MLKKVHTADRSRSGMLIKVCRYFSSTAYMDEISWSRRKTLSPLMLTLR